MEIEPTKYNEIGLFMDRIENQMRITKLVSEMSQSFKINFDIRRKNGRTTSYWRQVDAIYDNVVFAKYEDKDPIYINLDSEKRLDNEDVTTEFRDYVLRALNKRGVNLRMNRLELIDTNKSSINS